MTEKASDNVYGFESHLPLNEGEVDFREHATIFERSFNIHRHRHQYPSSQGYRNLLALLEGSFSRMIGSFYHALIARFRQYPRIPNLELHTHQLIDVWVDNMKTFYIIYGNFFKYIEDQAQMCEEEKLKKNFVSLLKTLSILPPSWEHIEPYSGDFLANLDDLYSRLS